MPPDEVVSSAMFGGEVELPNNSQRRQAKPLTEMPKALTAQVTEVNAYVLADEIMRLADELGAHLVQFQRITQRRMPAGVVRGMNNVERYALELMKARKSRGPASAYLEGDMALFGDGDALFPEILFDEHDGGSLAD